MRELVSQAGTDPGQRRAIVESLPPGQLRTAATREYLQTLAKTDPAAGAARGGSIRQRPPRSSTLKLVLAAMIERDPAGALHELQARLPEKSPGLFGDATINELVTAAATKQPQNAADWTLDLPDSIRQPAAMAAVREWVSKEPTAGLDWAQAHGVPIDFDLPDNFPRNLRNLAAPAPANSALAAAARLQPETTAAWLARLPIGAERERLVQHALSNQRDAKVLARLRAALGR